MIKSEQVEYTREAIEWTPIKVPGKKKKKKINKNKKKLKKKFKKIKKFKKKKKVFIFGSLLETNISPFSNIIIDNSDVIDLIDSKPKGIFSLLDR